MGHGQWDIGHSWMAEVMSVAETQPDCIRTRVSQSSARLADEARPYTGRAAYNSCCSSKSPICVCTWANVPLSYFQLSNHLRRASYGAVWRPLHRVTCRALSRLLADSTSPREHRSVTWQRYVLRKQRACQLDEHCLDNDEPLPPIAH